MGTPTSNEEQPRPDPGNSPPEDWTEDLDQTDLEEIRGRVKPATSPEASEGSES
jgi:hypothetical protein